jgi:hypothetical protein
MNDILKICDFVTTLSRSSLLDMGCRIRTTNKPLPWRDEQRILIPYRNKITLSIKSILHDKMDLNTVARLVGPGCYWADPLARAQVAFQALHHMVGKNTVARDLEAKKYMWRGSRPKYKIKALEIPADVAMKFLVLGGLS